MKRGRGASCVALVAVACAIDGGTALGLEVDETTRGPAHESPRASVGAETDGPDAGATTSEGVTAAAEPDAWGSGGGGSGSSDPQPTTTGADPLPGPPFELLPLPIPHAILYGVYGPGQAWGDLDGDGWLELVTVGGAGQSHVWANAAGTLDASPLSAQLAPYLDTAGVTMPDYDNDGDPDLYLLRLGSSVLLRNDGGEILVDVSAAAGVDHDGHPSSATWGDYDGDGHLDLYVTMLGTEPDILYHSEGDGTFTDRTDLLPGMFGSQAFAASFSDFDDDGDLDLYVVNDKNDGNRMWRSDGPGCGGWCFSDVGQAWGIAAEVFGMGLAVGDVDNDLDLDVSFSDIAAHHLYRRDDEGTQPIYVDVAAAAGVTFGTHGWGTLLFDYDNDGWLDLYVADSTLPGPESRMFRNLQGGTFADVSGDCGCVDAGWAFGASTADFDHDGRIDLVVGNRSVGHRVYRNVADTGHHWLQIELRGGGPVNRDAVGAKVFVLTTAGDVLRRDVELGSALASQSSLRLHFGLGDAEVAAVEIHWPDGTVQEPPPPPTDALWVLDYPGPG